MEKNTYENYEFLSSANPGSNTNQFFVLQDDGTILTVNKEIQYITRGEDNEDTGHLNPTEECSTVFDVPPQQYYVEFEGNAAEMISLNDQFAIASGDNHVYANSYLIQPETTSAPHQMGSDTAIDPQKLDAQQMQHLNIEAFNGVQQKTDLTEITLTDEQYQMLEHKGWLLLESNNKIFVLNTLGLHDITANEKLIQRLKHELLENTDTNGRVGQLKIESVSTILPNDSAEEDAQERGSVVEYFITNNQPLQELETIEKKDVDYDISGNVENEMNVGETDNSDAPTSNAATEAPAILNNLLNNFEVDNDGLTKCDSMKIKTKYTFRDIPDKIFLGKTVDGKRLFAKVKKKNNNQELRVSGKSEKKPYYNSLLDAAMFTNLIQDSYKHTPNSSPECVEFADRVVTQLLRLPNLTDSVVQNNLIITKVITSHTENVKEVGIPTIVTGFMKVQDDDYVFTHAPNMLRELIAANDCNKDNNLKVPKTEPLSSSPKEKIARGLIDLFHIHISELRLADSPPETSIHLSKRKIPVDVLNDAKKRHPNPAYACGTCGGVFRSEQQLKDHQDDVCIDVEDELTIDYTDDVIADSPSYFVSLNGKEKVFSCTLCEEKFKRLYNCKKHIKAHQAGIEKKLKVYKCKMCPNTYFHSSSLSKHILKTHIQTKLNNV